MRTGIRALIDMRALTRFVNSPVATSSRAGAAPGKSSRSSSTENRSAVVVRDPAAFAASASLHASTRRGDVQADGDASTIWTKAAA